MHPEDVWALVCDQDLLPHLFPGQRHRATLASFEEVAQRLARIADPDDGLLLVVTNHGDPEGLLVDTPPPDEFADDLVADSLLSPDVLGRHLATIPGHQITIIATCYAGIFLPLASERRAVLTACGAGDVYRIRIYEHDPPRSPFLYELLTHWAGVSLANYETPEPRPLAEAFATIEPDCPTCQRQGTSRWPGERS